MSYNYSFGEDDEFGLDEENKEQVTQVKDCILFAIDCSKSMLQENMEGAIPVVVALKSVRSTLLHKIDNKKTSDIVGVVLFGTREKENAADKDHIVLMQPIDTPDATRINKIDELIENLSLLEKRYGSMDEPLDMGAVFWLCSDIMAGIPTNSTKRIFLITDNDDPAGENAALKRDTIQRAKDLSIAGIELSLFGIDKPDTPFDINVFYKDVVSFSQYEESTGPTSGTAQLNQLLDKIISSQNKVRSQFKIPFQMTPKLEVGIRGYNMVVEKKLETPKKFSSSTITFDEVKPTTRWQCEDTKQYLTPLDIHVGYEYGGETVVFTKEEIKKIKFVRKPSLLLLGFKQRQALKTHHQVSHPYFIYPDESQYKGSNDVILTLIDAMVRRKRIAICSLIRRENTMPKIVALIPQLENLDANGNRTDPGFQMIILPYADEIRPIPPMTIPNPVDTKDRENAKVLIEKLMIPEGYDPSNYPNPSIRSQKNMIQGTALASKSGIEEVVDNSVPNYNFIESNLAEAIEKFKTAVGLENITVDDLNDYSQPKSALKRKQEGSEGSDPSKRAKDDESIVELWHAGKLNKATNQYLKDYLTTVGIEPKRLKADLIEQVVTYLQAKQ